MGPKIIIRAPNHLGDCLMALPMINEAREAYRGATVTLLVGQAFAPLFEPNQAIDRILSPPMEHLHGLISTMKIKDLIAPHNFDIGYVLPPSFGAAAGFKLGGVKERIGYISDGRRLLLTRPLPLPEPINSAHRSELYFDLLRRGASADLEFVKPKLFLSDDEVTGASNLVAGFGIEPDDKYVVMACRAKAESRRWGIENYVDLVKKIVAKHQTKIVLIGGAEDSREGEEITALAGGHYVINLAGKTNLRETAAVLSGSALFIGNDSGPAHLAATVGIPLIVLWGAGDPKSTAQLSSRMSMMRREQLECISCVKNKCPNKGDDFMRCMKEISVEDVLTQVEKTI